ncbi:MAG: ribosome biogenesis GTPase Der, partial [Gammaproteobacteria bacterium]|nr:ribosome biogenesis GTPase Der [Gammaproteobacteria bacterium]
PNVGKSTLFNRLTRSRDALVADYSGLTRDRKYGEARVGEQRFIVIDTGGLSGLEQGIDRAMAQQSLAAIEEADEVLLLVDARAGLLPADEAIVKQIRARNKPFRVVANKMDGVDESAAAEFYQLGTAQVFPIAASHGRGVTQLLEELLPAPDDKGEPVGSEEDNARWASTRIAVVGRPNVGKSTLVNRMLGEERVVVFDHPGTTRDSIYIDYEREDKQGVSKPYTLIDTAGVRRRKNVAEAVEKFSILKALQAIADANVTVLLIDAREGLVDQDLHLLSHVVEAGRALVIAVNKWDGLSQEHKNRLKSEIDRRMAFNDFAELRFISALHGTGVGELYRSVDVAYAAATQKLATNELTRVLEKAVFDHPPPSVGGRRIKLRYAHAGGQNPPIIVIHGNQAKQVPRHYTRYLEKTFRRAFKLFGTPVRIEFRSGDNPYAGRKNKLTPRQVSKRRRLMSHVKKKKNTRGR